MSDESTKRLVAEIDTDLKELVKADNRTIREIVESSLWREFGGERKGALERRIEEKKRRVSIIESEKNERERELEQEREELEALNRKYESTDSAVDRVVKEASQTLSGELGEAQAEHWAEKAGISIDEFRAEYNTTREDQ